MNKLLSLHLAAATTVAALGLSFGSLVDFKPAAPEPAPAEIAVETMAPVETSTARPVTPVHRVPPGRPVNV